MGNKKRHPRDYGDRDDYRHAGSKHLCCVLHCLAPRIEGRYCSPHQAEIEEKPSIHASSHRVKVGARSNKNPDENIVVGSTFQYSFTENTGVYGPHTAWTNHKEAIVLEYPYEPFSKVSQKTYRILEMNELNWAIEEVNPNSVSGTDHSVEVVKDQLVVTNDIAIQVDINSAQEGNSMNGNVYQGYVVVTRTVPAGDGVNVGHEVSTVVYSTDNAVVAGSVDQAKAIILARAVRKDAKLNVEDPLAMVEVKLTAAAQ